MGRTSRLVAATAAAGLVAGCTGTEPGEAVPGSPTPSSSAGAGSPDNGAPKVERPLNVQPLLAAPCDTLTESQVETFLGSGASAKAAPEGITGPECSWTTDHQHARIYLTFPDLDDAGLTSLYRNRQKGEFFEEMPPAAGYPVVAYGITDNRGEGECTVRVGVSDRDTVDITLYLSDDKVGQLDPCEAAHEVATAVIGNIKARN
ncbi:DUF3558 domain-containing protein [Prauserella muralis]|uniref:Uncharacterized protein n=1 Tax=Prauserella muralis TaxID=588067 RepID=A0A2V4BN49_9PSEU|nr:DUF3558 domain-containing protein [Prauserella muralis]PXY32063.1 hypothetical protein BAY60_07060 [Prauserella muralis]TWE13490.1 uncharacterized protein DUF3558 [Prauserella muralis]